jgi:hypothetical protein
MHRKHIAAAFLLVILLLAACVAGKPQVTVTDDQFSKDVVIFGWGNYVNNNPWGGIFRDWRLRSFVDKQTHAVSHQSMSISTTTTSTSISTAPPMTRRAI